MIRVSKKCSAPILQRVLDFFYYSDKFLELITPKKTAENLEQRNAAIFYIFLGRIIFGYSHNVNCFPIFEIVLKDRRGIFSDSSLMI